MSHHNGNGTTETKPRASLADRLPPFNTEAEQGVIGSIFLDPTTLHDVSEIIRPGDFYHANHATIYERIAELYCASKPVDSVSVMNELKRRNEYEGVGGDEGLSTIIASVPHAANAKYYAQLVREKAIGRELIAIATKILRDAYSNSFTAEEQLELAEKAIFDLAGGHFAGGVKTIGQILSEVYPAILRRKEEGDCDGLASPWRELNKVTKGFKPEQFIVLAGRPGMGKSAAAWNIADHLAVDYDESILFISLEMGEASLAERSLVSRGMVDGSLVQEGKKLNRDDLDRLKQANTALQPAKIFVSDSSTQTILQIASISRRLKAQHNLGLIVIDYLQLVTVENSKASRQEQVAEISRRLKMLARELKIPIIGLSQLNRAVESREDRRPRMADLRESGAIEQDADIVLLLFRPDYYDPKDSPGVTEVIIGKNRNGPMGTVQLKFFDKFTRFVSLEQHESNDRPMSCSDFD